MHEHPYPERKDEDNGNQGADADDNEYSLQATFVLVLDNNWF